MTTKIIFLCPHNAAKSVIAAALCQGEASRRGMNLTIDSAGTEPDEVTAPPVVAMLARDGMDVTRHRPRGVRSEDFLDANWVVSMGCDIAAMVTNRAALKEWTEVPAPSEDLRASRAYIERAVFALLDEIQASAA